MIKKWNHILKGNPNEGLVQLKHRKLVLNAKALQAFLVNPLAPGCRKFKIRIITSRRARGHLNWENTSIFFYFIKSFFIALTILNNNRRFAPTIIIKIDWTKTEICRKWPSSRNPLKARPKIRMPMFLSHHRAKLY